MALVGLSGIFGSTGNGAGNLSASVDASGSVTLHSGCITSYLPVSTGNPAAEEFVFGMCETMCAAVSGAGLTNLTSSAVTQFVSASNTLQKTYTFTVNLDFVPSTVLGQLNVKSG
jgi:hypothetical protein